MFPVCKTNWLLIGLQFAVVFFIVSNHVVKCHPVVLFM